MNRVIRTLSLLLFLLSIPMISTAENSTREAGFAVHHNAFPAAILTPEIAGNYEIVRSKYRGVINVSVIKEQTGSIGTPVSARVKVVATNLIGQVREVAMREIREEQAIYYIGDFPIVNNDTIRFKLEVTPAGTQQRIKAELSQEFFID